MQNITTQQLAVVNEIIGRMAQEHIDEGFPAPTITWTGETKNQNGSVWYKFKFINDMGTYMFGWTDGKANEGVINFIEE